MSAAQENRDDLLHSLKSIKAACPNSSITSQLIKIQTAKVEQRKSFGFIEHLECLSFLGSSNRLQLRQINAFEEHEYVALSYTWDPSPFEANRQAGGYQVIQRGSHSLEPSPVRDGVFNRIRKYMEHTSTKYLWIDQHGIEQNDGRKKEMGMNAMDRVYSLSLHPVALLTKPINVADDLELLIQILEGKLVEEYQGMFRLSTGTPSRKASRAIRILSEITSDTWFTRGWTFQENYRAGTCMRFLIPHAPELRDNKPARLLGSLDGELCVSSVKFHEEATRLCLAYQRDQPESADLCGEILARAGKYTILLQREGHPAPQSMTPTIMKDLVARDVKIPWDYLPIAANCCQYSVRLDSTFLQENRHSLSLSLLTLCLLNGEILSNEPQSMDDFNAAQALPIAEYLETQFFGGLRSPGPGRSLTFNKGCRFVDAMLTEEGIQTKGHLWKSSRLIRTSSFQSGHHYDRSAENRLGYSEEWRLRQLIDALNDSYDDKQRDLAHRLHYFLENNCDTTGRPLTFSQEWQIRMANLVALAIEEGKMLCTAFPIDSSQSQRRRGCAIIIPDNDDVDQTFFTAFAPERNNSDMFDSNDISRHVSLEVDLVRRRDRVPLPKLYTRRWVHGLYFFDRCPLQSVVFPWPDTLRYL